MRTKKKVEKPPLTKTLVITTFGFVFNHRYKIPEPNRVAFLRLRTCSEMVLPPLGAR
jgi:hypothetical protein